VAAPGALEARIDAPGRLLLPRVAGRSSGAASVARVIKLSPSRRHHRLSHPTILFMAPRHVPDSLALRHAVILLERPVVGRDGHRGRERVPASVRVRATVVGGAPVDCTIDIGAVQSAAGVEDPTWSDLQMAWQRLATILHGKIRAGAFEAQARHPAVRVGRDDVPTGPQATAATLTSS